MSPTCGTDCCVEVTSFGPSGGVPYSGGGEPYSGEVPYASSGTRTAAKSCTPSASAWSWNFSSRASAASSAPCSAAASRESSSFEKREEKFVSGYLGERAEPGRDRADLS